MAAALFYTEKSGRFQICLIFGQNPILPVPIPMDLHYTEYIDKYILISRGYRKNFSWEASWITLAAKVLSIRMSPAAQSQIMPTVPWA